MLLDISTFSIPAELIDQLHKKGFVERDALFEITPPHGEFDEGGFVLLTALEDPKKSALGVCVGDQVRRVTEKGAEFWGIKPRDKQQLCMFYSLAQFDLTVALGGAGTGKTTLALAFALQQMSKAGKNLILTKPTRLVGGSSDAWGTLPGGKEEKLEPYFESFLIPMKKLLGSDVNRFIEEWLETGKLVAQPIETIRGCSFEGCTLIIDEAQNLTAHELASIVSRVAADSKCIILGDPSQIDIDIPWRETGLCQLLSSDTWFDSEIVGGIRLTAQYRGPLAHLAAEFLAERSGASKD